MKEIIMTRAQLERLNRSHRRQGERWAYSIMKQLLESEILNREERIAAAIRFAEAKIYENRRRDSKS